MDEYSFKIAEISPQYLLALSRQVDALSRQYQQLRLGSLTQDFSNTLTAEFNDLSQYLSLYHNDSIMRASSLFRCRGHLQLYTLTKASLLISRDNPQLSAIIDNSLSQLKEVLTNCEGLILEERRSENRLLESEKDKVIGHLRREVGIKREYTADLEERVRQLQDENSQLYSKLITAAKQTSDFAIRGSPAKIKHLLATTQLSLQRPLSPRKKVSVRGYEEEVMQILQSKFRQQGIKQRHVSLDEYLRTYFTMKYGKPLAEQNEASFREAVGLLARAQQRHLFLLFQAILQEQCEEAYFFEDKQAHERVAKCIRRYLQEKYGRPQHQLERLLDWRNFDQKGDIALSESDLEPILSNIYKSTEITSLESIISEMISSRPNNEKGVTCRRLLGQVLNYELSKHNYRVETVVKEARRAADGNSTLSYEQLQQVMVRIVKDKSKYPLLIRYAGDAQSRRFTISETIEIIERIRRTKTLPRD